MSFIQEPVTAQLSRMASRDVDRVLWQEYITFAENEAHVYRDTSPAQHLTVSAFIFDTELEQILLCFHRKGRFWVQLGGHIEESDLSLASASRREAEEESGLDIVTLERPTPVDLDRHALTSGFGSCQVHWDIGFAFTADRAAVPVASDESERVAWWPVSALPDGSVPGLYQRVLRVVRILREE